MKKTRLEIAFFAVLCTIIVVLTYFVFKPFLNILILAAVLSLIFQPAYKKNSTRSPEGKKHFCFRVCSYSTHIFNFTNFVFRRKNLGASSSSFKSFAKWKWRVYAKHPIQYSTCNPSTVS